MLVIQFVVEVIFSYTSKCNYVNPGIRDKQKEVA